MIKEFIDISRPISKDATVYPGDSPLGVQKMCSIGPDCPCNITELYWTTHFLTHIDPPLHFIENGASLDDIPLSRYAGHALVVEINSDYIDANDIPKDLDIQGKNLLFKTRNSSLCTVSSTFEENHIYITKAGADELVNRGVNLVGIDYLSVDKFGDNDFPAHRTLLGGNVLVVEGLDLGKVSPGSYYLFAFPLKIERGDGSPIRAVLAPYDPE